MSDASPHDDRLADGRLANGRFAEGNPGGPGRPRAAERVAALDRRAAEVAPALIDALIATAKAGNVKAIEMLLSRVWPVRRGHPVQIDAPEIRSIADLLPASAALTTAVFTGDLTPHEGQAAAQVLATHNDVVGLLDFDKRLAAAEKEIERRKKAG